MEERIEIEDLLFLALAKAWKGWVVNTLSGGSLIVGFEWTHFHMVKALPHAAWAYRHGLQEVGEAKAPCDDNPQLKRKLLKMFSDNEAYEAVKHDMD